MTYATPMNRYPGRIRSSARIVQAAMIVAGRLYRSSSVLTAPRRAARAWGALAAAGPASGDPSPCVMKLPQRGSRKVSPDGRVMTVCDSSVLAPLAGKETKRDVRRSRPSGNCDFGRMEARTAARALLHTAELLYTVHGR